MDGQGRDQEKLNVCQVDWLSIRNGFLHLLKDLDKLIKSKLLLLFILILKRPAPEVDPGLKDKLHLLILMLECAALHEPPIKIELAVLCVNGLLNLL